MTKLDVGKVQTLESAVGSIVGIKIKSRMLVVSSLKSARKIHGVLGEWPIIRRYSSILLHSVLFSFVGGLSHSESRGGPSSVMLEPDKSRSFFHSPACLCDSALLCDVVESRGGIEASECERGERLHIHLVFSVVRPSAEISCKINC